MIALYLAALAFTGPVPPPDVAELADAAVVINDNSASIISSEGVADITTTTASNITVLWLPPEGEAAVPVHALVAREREVQELQILQLAAMTAEEILRQIARSHAPAPSTSAPVVVHRPAAPSPAAADNNNNNVVAKPRKR